MEIKISKSAEVKISPDTAVFSITLSRKGKNGEAYSLVTALAQSVKKQAESAGVAIKFKNTMMRERTQEKEEEEFVCSIDAEARIPICDFKALTAFEAILSENGARFFVSYDASQKEKARKEALRLALDGAKKSAEEISARFGARVADVKTVEYRSDNCAVPVMMRMGSREELSEISVRESVDVTFTAV